MYLHLSRREPSAIVTSILSPYPFSATRLLYVHHRPYRTQPRILVVPPTILPLQLPPVFLPPTTPQTTAPSMHILQTHRGPVPCNDSPHRRLSVRQFPRPLRNFSHELRQSNYMKTASPLPSSVVMCAVIRFRPSPFPKQFTRVVVLDGQNQLRLTYIINGNIDLQWSTYSPRHGLYADTAISRYPTSAAI